MNDTDQSKQLLRVGVVAAMLDIGVSTVWRGVKKGTLLRPLHIGGSTRWRRADIEALLRPEEAA
jgi:predicted DNA-binding transcriptional regulator AlpA